MTARTRVTNGGHRLLALLGVALLAVAGTILPAVTATAASPKISVSPNSGLKANGLTKVKLSGTGFQSVKGGFGGIYVLFGWVSSPNGKSWRPSEGGSTGKTYRYVSDNEDNPAGYEVFVSFPDSSTESAANGGTIKANGSWSATIKIPGAKFTSVDRDGKRATINCLKQQCGIITVGAHGVKNANNETFTPVSFSNTAAVTGADNSSAAATSDSTTQAQDDAAKSTAAVAAAQASPTTPAATNIAPTQAVNNTPLLTTILWSIAILVAALTLMVLAAGIGGYLASKSILLGVSPTALAKEKAKRDAAAARVARKAEYKEAKRVAKHNARMATISDTAAAMRQPVIDDGRVQPSSPVAGTSAAGASATAPAGATGAASSAPRAHQSTPPTRQLGGFFANRARSHDRPGSTAPGQGEPRA